MGLMPRNGRKPLGRGRGSTSWPHPDAFDCAKTLARLTHQGSNKTCRCISLRFYPYMYWRVEGEPLPAERVIRKSLVEDYMSRITPHQEADQAYWDAQEMAGPSGRAVYPIHLEHLSFYSILAGRRFQEPRDRSGANSAYQHVQAALNAGFDEVGHDVLAQSLLELGWAQSRTINETIQYLESSRHKPRNTLKGLAYDTFEKLCHQASMASAISFMWANEGTCESAWRPNEPAWLIGKDLRNSDLQWILLLPCGYGDPDTIHHAMIADPVFAAKVEQFLNAE